MALLAPDEAGISRATVAGVLLCTRNPEQWLPNACITATRYRGRNHASGQVDAQEIVGPLNRQIADGVAFMLRNMHVAARKEPARVDLPQYSDKALFEALVNAVVHRDYSMRNSRIRLSMFEDRLELQSPGSLPNNLTVDSMVSRQATRNETLTSVLGRMPVQGIRGSEERQYFMERRGDGIHIILSETQKLLGKSPVYRLINESEVHLIIPAAVQEQSSARAVVTVWSSGLKSPQVPGFGEAQKTKLADTLAKIKEFSFPVSIDELDKQYVFTLVIRDLVVQLQTLAGPILPAAAKTQLRAISVDVGDFVSASRARAELDALLPAVEDALASFSSRSDVEVFARDSGKETADRSIGQPLSGADLLILFPNKTWKHAITNKDGEATIDLHTTHLPMTVFAAAPGYAAFLKREWIPSREALAIELEVLREGGSIIFSEATGSLPGLKGRLNPIRDALDQPISMRLTSPLTRGNRNPYTSPWERSFG